MALPTQTYTIDWASGTISDYISKLDYYGSSVNPVTSIVSTTPRFTGGKSMQLQVPVQNGTYARAYHRPRVPDVPANGNGYEEWIYHSFLLGNNVTTSKIVNNGQFFYNICGFRYFDGGTHNGPRGWIGANDSTNWGQRGIITPTSHYGDMVLGPYVLKNTWIDCLMHVVWTTRGATNASDGMVECWTKRADQTWAQGTNVKYTGYTSYWRSSDFPGGAADAASYHWMGIYRGPGWDEAHTILHGPYVVGPTRASVDLTGGSGTLPPPPPPPPPTTGLPQTPFETNKGARFSTFAEREAYIDSLNTASTRVAVATIGTTAQGRAIRMLKVGPARTDAEIKTSIPFLVVAHQHGDEPAGGEAALAFARDHAASTSTQTVLIIPTANPDGYVGGTRTNSAGVDINRDYIALSQAESKAIQQVLRDFAPQVSIDMHEHNRTTKTIWHNDLSNQHPEVNSNITTLRSTAINSYLTPALTDAGYATADYDLASNTPTTLGMSAMLRGDHLSIFTESAYASAFTLTERVQAHVVAAGAIQNFSLSSITTQINNGKAAQIAKGGTTTYTYQLSVPLSGDTFSAASVGPPAPLAYDLTTVQFNSIQDQLDRIGIKYEPVTGGQRVWMNQDTGFRAFIGMVMDSASPSELVSATRVTTGVSPPPPPPPPPVSTPTTPTGVVATATGTTTVHLDWDDSPDASFSYFAVRRTTDPTLPTGSWTRLSGGPNGNGNWPTSQADDTGLSSHTTYYYIITQNWTTGEISSPSSTVNVTTLSPPPPVTPTGLHIADSSRSHEIDLDWNNNTDLLVGDSYQVYQDGVKIRDGLSVSNYTVTGLVDGVSHSFQVSAGATGRYSTLSAGVNGSSTAPSVPTGWITVAPSSGTVPQTLTATVNTTGLLPGVYTANITITPTQAGSDPYVVPVNLTVSSTTDTTPPTVPSGIEIVSSGPSPTDFTKGSAFITWNDNSETDLDSLSPYIVEKSLSLNGPWTQIAQTAVSEVEITDLPFAAHTYIAIRAKDRAGNLSARPTPPLDVFPLAPLSPVSTGVRVVEGDGQLTLIWPPAPASQGVKEYHVYIKVTGDATYPTIPAYSGPGIPSGNSLSCVIPGLTNDVTYRIKIVAAR